MGNIKDLGPLDWRIGIVDKAGRPTAEFQRRWANQIANNNQIGTLTLGSGVPTGSDPADGAEYVDTSTDPYTLYVANDGTWHQVGPVSFTQLDDTPDNYTGAALKLVHVNAGATGLEFISTGSLAANPTAVASDTAVNGSASTYMRSDAAPAVQKASSSQFGVVKVDGTTITSSGGVISGVSQAITISLTAPSTPSAGDLWWKSDEGRLKIYYTDSDSSQWVDAFPAVPGPRGPTGATGAYAWGTPAAWLTATAYTSTPPASVVTVSGSSYVCLTSHTSGTFATDLAAGKWLLVASKGDAGATGPAGANNTVSEASFTTPTVAGFATTRAGSGTINNTSDGIILRAPGTSSNTNELIYALATISAGASGWRYTARIRRNTPFAQWGMMGLIVRNGSSGGSVTMGLGLDSLSGFNRNVFTNDTTWASVSGIIAHTEFDLWLRVRDDLTNRIWEISRYGNTWQQIYSEARTTGVTPTQVGVFINPNFGGGTTGVASLRAEVSMSVFSSLFESLP